jgi:peroxiredoxin Q/BCP
MGLLGFLGLVSCKELPIGADAPRLTVTDQNGAALNLAQLFSTGMTLVYFYPKADTPGCTAQACGLRDSHAQLERLGVHVLGVSGDSAPAQRQFQTRHNLPFTLVADTDKKLMDAFGVPHFFSAPKRQSFLIRNGKIVWRDLSAKTKDHVADVLEALKRLESKS